MSAQGCLTGGSGEKDIHVVLDRLEESLQPLIGGSVRKIAGKNLEERGERASECATSLDDGRRHTHLEAGLLDDGLLRSRGHAVLGDRGGGGVGHFEGVDGG